MGRWKAYNDNNSKIYVISIIDWTSLETTYVTAVGDDQLNSKLNELCEIKDKKIDFVVFRRVSVDYEEK